MKYFKKIKGKKCYLSPVNVEDAEKYTEWINDPEVSVNLTFFSKVISFAKEKELLEKISKEDYHFAVIDLESDDLIGGCSLNNVDPFNKTAEVGIFIGNKAYWNKGYGEEALRLLLDYSFNILNLNNIMLNVYSYNKRALRCYEKCGFKKIGIRRDSKVFGAKKYDIILMDILSRDFKGSMIESLISD